MENLLRRLARAAAASAAESEAPSSPDMQPLPTPSIQNLAAAAAGKPPPASPTDAVGASNGHNGWDISSLNSTLADNFTLYTEGSRDHSTTPRGHVMTDEAWPVSSFAVIKALVLVVILAILVIVSCKVTMQYVIKSSKREKR